MAIDVYEGPLDDNHQNNVNQNIITGRSEPCGVWNIVSDSKWNFELVHDAPGP